MRFPVNLATKPMEMHRFFLTVCWSLIAILALPFPWVVWHLESVRKLDAKYRIQSEISSKEIDSLIEQKEELERFFSRPENAKLQDRANFINSILDAQSLNWTRMFLGLERVLPGGVRVLSIEPRLDNGQAAIKLTVGAMTEDAKRTFLSALEQSGDFSNVALISVRMSAPGAAGDPIVMELTVTYAGVS